MSDLIHDCPACKGSSAVPDPSDGESPLPYPDCDGTGTVGAVPRVLTLTPNQAEKRINTCIVMKEWPSDRDPHFADYQIGGFHYKPLGKRSGRVDPKIQVTHYTQQRTYAALRFYMSPERGYDEAWNIVLDGARLAEELKRYDPELYETMVNGMRESKRAVAVRAVEIMGAQNG